MLILVALALAALFIALCHKPIRAHAGVFYIAAAAITLLADIVDFTFMPAGVRAYTVDLFTHGTFATALWIVIMWTGALKNGSPLMKILMPIRGQLSIFAAILTICHNVFYGKTYFLRLFTAAPSMPAAQLAAAIISVVMIVLLVPLTVTSFMTVRKKMQARSWKKLQRWAYLYYGLLYVHIMLVTMPGAHAGKLSSIVSVMVYTALFLAYACFRVRKYLVMRKKLSPKKTAAVAAAVIAAGMLVLCGELWLMNSADEPAAPAAETQTDETQPADEGESASGGAVTVEGSAYGYDGDVYVTVTVENGLITTITGYTEETDPYYFDMCFGKVSTAIIDTQSCEVDAVSGATYSSQAIMDAVSSALRKID